MEGRVGSELHTELMDILFLGFEGLVVPFLRGFWFLRWWAPFTELYNLCGFFQDQVGEILYNGVDVRVIRLGSCFQNLDFELEGWRCQAEFEAVNSLQRPINLSRGEGVVLEARVWVRCVAISTSVTNREWSDRIGLWRPI